MKVLFVHDGTLYRTPDGKMWGVAVNNRTLSRYYRIADEVSVAVRVQDLDASDDVARYSLIDSKIKVHSVPNLMSIKGLTVGTLAVRKRLENLIGQYDCVVARLSGLVGMEAANVCRSMGVPYIVECVGNPSDSMRYHGRKGRLVAPILARKTRESVEHAKYVIYVTDEYLQRVFPTDGKWVACSNVVLAADSLDNGFERMYRGLADATVDSPLVLGSAGKIDMHYKGYHYVVEALASLKSEGIFVEYQLAGGGDNSFITSQARKFGVSDCLKLQGSMTNESVLEWMSSLDLYLQPSETEGLPRALIEAMSVGCPCVGSDAGGIPELLDPRFVFPRGNVPELINAIKKALENPREAGTRNRDKSKEYALDVISNRRDRFFDMFVDEELAK